MESAHSKEKGPLNPNTQEWVIAVCDLRTCALLQRSQADGMK